MAALLLTSCSSATYACAAEKLQNQRTEEAMEILRPLVNREPRNLKARNLLGIALTQSGQLAEGSKVFREALAADPTLYPAAKNQEPH